MTQIRSQWLGILFILVAQLLFSTNFSIVTFLSPYFSITQLIFFRSILGPFLLLPFFLSHKLRLDLSRPWMLVLRSSCGLIAMTCLYAAFRMSDIGNVTLLFNFSVIWTFIAAFFIFKDRTHQYSLISLFFAFIGLGLVFFPFSVFINMGSFFALMGSFFAAGVVLSLKSLRSTHDSLSVVFFFQVFSSFVYFGPAQLSISLIHGPFFYLLLISGCVSFLAQFFLTSGYKHITASVGAAVSLAQIPLMYISGYLFFDQHITLINMIGVFIVLLSLTIISIFR